MNKRIVIVITACVTTFTAAAALLHARSSTQPASTGAAGAAEEYKTPGGCGVVVVKPGEGAKNGDIVFIHYSGKLTDGRKFDSSYDRGEPISLVLGAGQVIPGWEEGLQGMQVGEKRHLTIPPNLAYGEEGRGDKIPPNATLVFDVELMGLQRK